MKSQEFIDMARMILDLNVHVREEAADEITDRLNAYAPVQASALATLLAATAVSEHEDSALEAELHAVLELASTGHVDVEHISALHELDLEELPPQLREYVIDLLEG